MSELIKENKLIFENEDEIIDILLAEKYEEILNFTEDNSKKNL